MTVVSSIENVTVGIKLTVITFKAMTKLMSWLFLCSKENHLLILLYISFEIIQYSLPTLFLHVDRIHGFWFKSFDH